LLTLKAPDAEKIIIEALEDPDDKVQWRATSALGELTPLSDASVARIIQMIQGEIPEEIKAAETHSRKVCNIIRSLGIVATIHNIQAIEAAILGIAETTGGQKKGLLQRLKKTAATPQTAIMSTAIATLGKIGTSQSVAFLGKIAASKTPQAEAARKAVQGIQLRYARQQQQQQQPPPPVS
jgi:HEAT repeat protein